MVSQHVFLTFCGFCWNAGKYCDFTRIRRFRNIPMNIGQMVSMNHPIWLTVWLIHTKWKITTLGSKRVMKVLEYFGHEAFLEYSSFITEINELGLYQIRVVSFRFFDKTLPWTIYVLFHASTFLHMKICFQIEITKGLIIAWRIFRLYRKNILLRMVDFNFFCQKI